MWTIWVVYPLILPADVFGNTIWWLLLSSRLGSQKSAICLMADDERHKCKQPLAHTLHLKVEPCIVGTYFIQTGLWTVWALEKTRAQHNRASAQVQPKKSQAPPPHKAALSRMSCLSSLVWPLKSRKWASIKSGRSETDNITLIDAGEHSPIPPKFAQ